MADFKTHVSFGSYAGFIFSIFTYMLEWVTNIYFVVLIFFATIIGSILPDMDSDSGLPVKVIFGLYAYFTAAITIFYLNELDASIYFKIFLPAASFVFINTTLLKFFKKQTIHRGIFHSVPALFILFFVILLIADTTHLKTIEKFVLALSVTVGYFSHLFLDEIYSINMFTKRSRSRSQSKKKFSLKKYLKKNFSFKRSFGTALELGFRQRRKYPAIIAYIVLVVLFYFSYPILLKIIKVL